MREQSGEGERMNQGADEKTREREREGERHSTQSRAAWGGSKKQKKVFC